jgi:hypothetical protein
MVNRFGRQRTSDMILRTNAFEAKRTIKVPATARRDGSHRKSPGKLTKRPGPCLPPRQTNRQRMAAMGPEKWTKEEGEEANAIENLPVRFYILLNIL